MSAHAETGGRLRCSDWSTFLASDRFTDRRVANLEALSERRITDALRSMTGGGMDGIEPSWTDFLKRHMQVSAFVAEGTRRALARADALCGDPTVGRCLTIQTMMYERQAQAVVLYAMDLARQLGDISLEDARSDWEHGAVWAPARTLLAEAAAHDDWAEILVILNVCFEPLVGQLLRREFGSRAARAARDEITPAVAEAGQVEWGWVQAWTREFVAVMLADAVHGEENRATLWTWVGRHRPAADDAAARIATLADDTAWAPALREGLAAVRADQAALLDAAA